MDDKILINPNTGLEYTNVPPKVAAAYLDCAPTFIYEGLKQNVLPIGTAVKGEGGRYSYNIPIGRLKAYALGAENILQSLKEMIAQKA